MMLLHANHWLCNFQILTCDFQLRLSHVPNILDLGCLRLGLVLKFMIHYRQTRTYSSAANLFVLIVHLLSVIQGPKAASEQRFITGGNAEESDVLSEKLRLVWVCCAHAAMTAAVVAAPSAGSQAPPRSILQESHWRHTHPQVKPGSELFRTCLGGSLPISVCTACASFAAALGLCRTNQP